MQYSLARAAELRKPLFVFMVGLLAMACASGFAFSFGALGFRLTSTNFGMLEVSNRSTSPSVQFWLFLA
jgi:hypothetical protein